MKIGLLTGPCWGSLAAQRHTIVAMPQKNFLRAPVDHEIMSSDAFLLEGPYGRFAKRNPRAAEGFSALMETLARLAEASPGAPRLVIPSSRIDSDQAAALAEAGVSVAMTVIPVTEEMRISIFQALRDEYARLNREGATLLTPSGREEGGAILHANGSAGKGAWFEKGGFRVKLSESEANFLRFVARHSLVSSAYFFDRLYRDGRAPDAWPTAKIVDVVKCKINKRLAALSDSRPLLVTEWGIGLRLDRPVHIEEAVAAPEIRNPLPRRPEPFFLKASNTPRP